MQRFLTLLILCGIVGQASVRTAWTLHYQWNRAAYIAQCENKNKPSLHCDGKCAFKKEMAAREKSNSKTPQLPESFQQIKDIQLYFEAQPLPYLSCVEEPILLNLPPYSAAWPNAPVADIFRPPA